jgi:hypothetical protein
MIFSVTPSISISTTALDNIVFTTFNKCEHSTQYSVLTTAFFQCSPEEYCGSRHLCDYQQWNLYDLYDIKKKTVTMNSFIGLGESGTTQAHIICGAGREHVELVQTLNGLTVSPSLLTSFIFV